MSKTTKKTKFKCDSCEREFVNYSAYSKHIEVCQKCLRVELVNDPKFVLAHSLWVESYNGLRKKVDKKTFINHKDYAFFWKFSEFCVDLSVGDPSDYMKWLIKNRKKSNLWTDEKTLEVYIKYILISEEPIDAVSRSINFVKSYNGTYFSSLGAGTILTHLHMGRISPWFVLLYRDGYNTLLKKSTEEQQIYFNKLVNGVVWNVLIKKNKEDCEQIKTILSNERF